MAKSNKRTNLALNRIKIVLVGQKQTSRWPLAAIVTTIGLNGKMYTCWF